MLDAAFAMQPQLRGFQDLNSKRFVRRKFQVLPQSGVPKKNQAVSFAARRRRIAVAAAAAAVAAAAARPPQHQRQVKAAAPELHAHGVDGLEAVAVAVPRLDAGRRGLEEELAPFVLRVCGG